ncbi:MAG: hypothetical protein ABI347_02755 [Nitrososphaera sp.]|jgi:hypothetical protein
MFDKLIENALAQHMPGLKQMAEIKRAELAEIRAKVRTHPEEAEAWFDKEIEKLTDANIRGLIQNVKENRPSTILGPESSK